MPKIFVSYRRKSSEAITGRILDRMVAHYGKESIFIDIDNIPAGVDFRQRINQVLNESDIMIAVVGPKWLGSGKQGRISIHRENDWVRLEVESALRRNTLVIPVLVDGAQMPEASDLPDSLKDFVYRNAVIVASGRDFHTHVNQLIQSIDGMVAADAAKPAPSPEAAVPAKPPAGSGDNAPSDESISNTSAPSPQRIAGPEVIPAEAAGPIQAGPTAFFQEPEQITETPGVKAPQADRPPPVAPGQNLRKYFAAAAAAAVVVVSVVSYGAISYFAPVPQKIVLESAKPPTIVASPDSSPPPKAIPPAAPLTRSAEASHAVAAIPEPPPSPSPAVANRAPVQPPTPVQVPAPPVVNVPAEDKRLAMNAAPSPPPQPRQSCLARAASAQPNGGGVGGPFLPVAIRPNLADAKEVRAVAVSPTGREIATAGEDGLIRLWDTSSFRLIRTLKGHAGAIYSIDYWIDGTLLASASFDGTVRVWNPADGSTIQTFDTRSTSDSQGIPVRQFSVAFYPGTPLKYLASGGDDGIVRIWNIQNGQLESTRIDHQIPDGDKSTVRSLSFAPSGSGEFVTAGYDGKIRIYLATKHQVAVLDANARKTLRVSYSADSSRIVSAGSEIGAASQNFGSLKIWTVKTQSFKALLGHKDYVVSASWSPDGRYLVSGGGGRDKSIIVWDVEKGQQSTAFPGHQSDVEAVAFFAGGSKIVSVGEDKTIKVWSVPDRKELLTAVGFGERDYVIYTPEGCYAGSSGIENRVAIFSDNRLGPITVESQRALSVPEGFGSLLR